MRFANAVRSGEHQPALRVRSEGTRGVKCLAQARDRGVERSERLADEGIEAAERLQLAAPPRLQLALFADARHRLAKGRVADWHILSHVSAPPQCGQTEPP